MATPVFPARPVRPTTQQKTRILVQHQWTKPLRSNEFLASFTSHSRTLFQLGSMCSSNANSENVTTFLPHMLQWQLVPWKWMIHTNTMCVHLNIAWHVIVYHMGYILYQFHTKLSAPVPHTASHLYKTKTAQCLMSNRPAKAHDSPFPDKRYTITNKDTWHITLYVHAKEAHNYFQALPTYRNINTTTSNISCNKAVESFIPKALQAYLKPKHQRYVNYVSLH